MSRRRKAGRASSAGQAPSRTPAPVSRRPIARLLGVAALLVVLVLVAFGGGLRGEFVYDDGRQIVSNTLIQDPSLLGQALLSDVWAFKGEAGEAVSNYWRPAFVLHLAAVHRAFGLESALPWRAASLALHLGVTLTAFAFLLSLGLPPSLAGAAAALFAVHPSHVESVSWVSGAPDLLMAWPLLGAVWLARPPAGAERLPPLRLGLALACAAAAMAAKETAVVAPLLVAAVAAEGDGPRRARLTRAARRAAPFLAVAVLYVLARRAVLGDVARASFGHPQPLLETLLSAPAVLAFYVRQSLLPWTLGPVYPLRPVTPATLGLASFWLPLAALLALLPLAWCLARRGSVPRLGLALFLLPLAPALAVFAFPPEHTVHDRYLYLPLLGFWTALLGAVRPDAAPRTRAAVLAATAALGLVYVAQAREYAPAWRSDLALSERGSRSDPTSSWAWKQYAERLHLAGRTAEAKAAVERALDDLQAGSAPDALGLRARIALGEGRLDEAERDLRLLLAGAPDRLPGHELLAAVLQQRGDLAGAASVLEEARRRLPRVDCELGTNLAVVSYLAGDRAGARAELERLRETALRSRSAGCRQALFHLAELEREAGRPEEARRLYRLYLSGPETLRDARSERLRALARERSSAAPTTGTP